MPNASEKDQIEERNTRQGHHRCHGRIVLGTEHFIIAQRLRAGDASLQTRKLHFQVGNRLPNSRHRLLKVVETRSGVFFRLDHEEHVFAVLGNEEAVVIELCRSAKKLGPGRTVAVVLSVQRPPDLL